MFDPNKAKADKAAKAATKKSLVDLKLWANMLIPVSLQTGLILDVKEVVCGDPKCAPIDTVFTLLWPGDGRGMFAIPMSPEEIQTHDELAEYFPDVETLNMWSQGKRAPWPRRPSLRFDVGARVECRVGPHPLKGWVPGRIIKIHYTEPSWPPNMVAPYQIALHDGRLIFAPQDTDRVIRLRPPAAPDAPSSPEYTPNEDPDAEFEEGDEYAGEGDAELYDAEYDNDDYEDAQGHEGEVDMEYLDVDDGEGGVADEGPTTNNEGSTR